MNEGWYAGNYLVLFAPGEALSESERYSIKRWLPDFELRGLLGWDDFILRSADGQLFRAPTVPCRRQHLQPYSLPEPVELRPEPTLRGKIKWYITPLVFGGDPNDPANTVWVNPEKHGQLVAWWNERYETASAGSA